MASAVAAAARARGGFSCDLLGRQEGLVGRLGATLALSQPCSAKRGEKASSPGLVRDSARRQGPGWPLGGGVGGWSQGCVTRSGFWRGVRRKVAAQEVHVPPHELGFEKLGE